MKMKGFRPPGGRQWRLALDPPMFHIIKNAQSTKYKRSAGADPGFPIGGGANPLGGANIRICQIFRKTA